MRNNTGLLILALVLFFSMSGFGLTACNNTVTPTTTPAPTVTPGGPSGGAIINSDSIVTAKIQAIRKQPSGFPWELDVLVQASAPVGNLSNPTKDDVGKVITVKTDQNITTYKINDVVTARVKYVGDVPKPGITLYIYDIAMLIPPK